MISDRKQYIGIKNNIVFELFQFLFMLEWFLACISRFSAHIPTSFSVFMPNICCLDKLDNKHYAYRLIMMWEYGQKNEKYWPGSIPAHIRIGKVLNIVIFDTNNCLFYACYYVEIIRQRLGFWIFQLILYFVCLNFCYKIITLHFNLHCFWKLYIHYKLTQHIMILTFRLLMFHSCMLIC